MTFRLALPKGSGIGSSRPCADGQFGNVMKAYRDWKLSGQTDWLIDIWPSVKAAIEYAWHPFDNCDKWDPGKAGVLTGRQHHTLDMELFGPNAWLTAFYLGALLAGSEMAQAVGDDEAAQEYGTLFKKGQATVSNTLFNGEYFAQEIDLTDKSILSSFVWTTSSPRRTKRISKTCIMEPGARSDQVSDRRGLRDRPGPGGMARTLIRLGFDIRRRAVFSPPCVPFIDTIFVSSILGEHPNPCRVFGMMDESGTAMCAWPAGNERPAIPVPYSQETMHGFEYAFGCQLMMIGEIEKGIEVFAAVRDRYRGHNRNPWNEIECGFELRPVHVVVRSAACSVRIRRGRSTIDGCRLRRCS